MDNGSSYISGDLAKWLGERGMDHVRGAPDHPRTQGKIPSIDCCAINCRAVERWHQTLRNRILLENCNHPGALEEAIGDFVEHCNHRRYRESLGNLKPADVVIEDFPGNTITVEKV